MKIYRRELRLEHVEFYSPYFRFRNSAVKEIGNYYSIYDFANVSITYINVPFLKWLFL